ncbi:F0F1 ATP synthase subunit C (plasmid) [Pseudorhodobacter turbinis]|uniref:ATP synthase subunit c n=1 Tax=Pseudorhodobacter turbinis TaxID=2500533 RepID=A0A4P8EK60_9RHOB|nr:MULTISPECIES: F0F1 ATP synthase subunit C [Pseudorhodobacter]QCO57591.1 F0F1 ATP synthase subunit C [Pseudorhodobacter turbinis]
MTDLALIAMISIFTAGLTVSFGALGPALGEGRAAASALNAIAQQPDAASNLSRTLFVSLAMIESTAIYCFVVAMILLFANPFWNALIETSAQSVGG